jgi:N-acetylglucosamine kinase-like BadF-type ATPase
MEYYSADDFESAARLAGEADDPIQSLAVLGRIVCEAAQADNEIALAILQEGTQSLANDLVEMIEGAGLKRESLTLGMNGSIIVHNEIFRKLLGAAMAYDIPEIEWKATDLDPVFGAGLIGVRLKNIELDLAVLRASWENLRVQTLG